MESPFQIFTLIVAPAILTNSSSVLLLSTSNRFARVVDRSRAVYEKLKQPAGLTETESVMYGRQLPMFGQRSMFLVRALTSFYVAVGCFAATAFVAIGAAVLHLLNSPVADWVTPVALVTAMAGVVGLFNGTGLLAREMRMAHETMLAEVEITQSLFKAQKAAE